MIGIPTGFWGKLKQEGDRVLAWHPLADHCADVAACCEALLQRTLLRKRLATLGGLQNLSDIQVARLAVLAAFHDIGKFNIGFQNKALRSRPFVRGHVREVLAMLDDDWPARRMLLQSLPLDDLRAWGQDEAAVHLLLAAIGHHGRPVAIGGIDQVHQETPWKPARGLNPFCGIANLAASTRRWFPEAFSPSADGLPPCPAFQHAFSGLVMLADWLGSDTRFFAYSEADTTDRMTWARAKAAEALRRIGVDAELARSALGWQDPGFDRISAFAPHDTQRELMRLPIDREGSISLLEAETGSGKTEAALARYLRLFHAGVIDGMYFALPTRTAATQIHRRVVDAVLRAFPNDDTRPAVVMAVPGYLAVDDRTAARLPNFEVLWNDDNGERYRFRGWAAEHPKRYLVGPVVVGTVDQALLSTLMVSHAHLRSTALLRHLLVVDEVHASDAYMTFILREVVRNHVAAGGHVLLMSATLGSSAQQRLLCAVEGDPCSRSQPLAQARQAPYPLVTHCTKSRAVVRIAPHTSERSKEVRVKLLPAIGVPEDIVRAAFEAARQEARVLVLRNTVADCIATHQALEAVAEAHDRTDCLFTCGHVPAPHHARFAKEDRELLDSSLDTIFGANALEQGRVVVATQTVQQSLDIDVDLLITDLCPMDVLLQRIGRLHRHRRSRPAGFERPEVIVLVPEDRDLGDRITGKGEARGAHGIGTVYEDLRIIEATWRVLATHTTLSVPAMNRELVEDTTHRQALQAIVAGLGGAWHAHQDWLEGTKAADRRLARLNIIDRSILFGDDARIEFPSGDLDRRIQTRLGEGDRLVELDKPVTSPFGAPIQRLSIPAHLAREAGKDAEATDVTCGNESLRFTFADKSFVYDRLGLRSMARLPQGAEELADA